MALGRMLDSALVQKGLSELNKDLGFDVVNNRPDEWHYSFVLADPRYRAAIENQRLPITWREQYIVSMDRQQIPEFKQWNMVERVIEVPATPDGDEAFFSRTSPADTTYPAQLEKVRDGDPSYEIDGSGVITRWWVFRKVAVKGRVLLLGWRHTFERLIAANIPGITRESLAEKFGVEMYKYPIGPPEEVMAALTEE